MITGNLRKKNKADHSADDDEKEVTEEKEKKNRNRKEKILQSYVVFL